MPPRILTKQILDLRIVEAIIYFVIFKRYKKLIGICEPFPSISKSETNLKVLFSDDFIINFFWGETIGPST